MSEGEGEVRVALVSEDHLETLSVEPSGLHGWGPIEMLG